MQWKSTIKNVAIFLFVFSVGYLIGGFIWDFGIFALDIVFYSATPILVIYLIWYFFFSGDDEIVYEDDEEDDDDPLDELSDFEIHYFDACGTLDFKAHTKLTKKQIEQRYKELCEVEDDKEEIKELLKARNFLNDNLAEINDYIEKTPIAIIKERFEY